MTHTQLLVADVGNTRIKFAILKPGRSANELPECLHTFVIRPGDPFAWSAVLEGTGGYTDSLASSWLAGSNRERIAELATGWPAALPPVRIVESAVQLPIELDVDAPEKVGVDRVLNAVAVNRIRTAGQPAIIVDAGTAVTIDAVSSEGRFLGGAILPGFELEAHALHDYTSLLPHIPIEQILGQTPAVIGKNTQAALRSGLIWGQVGAVNEIVSRMSSSLVTEARTRPQFYLTGGAAPLLATDLRESFRPYPQLTLQGLGCVV